MEEKPIGGAPPPPTPKPKISNSEQPSFSYFDLFDTLITTEFSDNERWLIFGFEDKVFKIKEFEFYSFLNFSFQTEEFLLLEKKDGVVISEPDYEEEIKIQPSLLIDVETKKETEIKTFKCYNIVAKSKINVFEDEE